MELIIFIMIIGILAAIAIPRYIDMNNSAKIFAANSLTSPLKAATSIACADYVINSSNTANINAPTILLTTNISDYRGFRGYEPTSSRQPLEVKSTTRSYTNTNQVSAHRP